LVYGPPHRIRQRVKPWIAAVAAFAMTLQALLSTVLVAQAAAPAADARHFGIICLSHSDPDQNEGKQDDTRHACCVLCAGVTGPADIPRSASIIALDPLRVLLYVVPLPARSIAPHPTPRMSQGPPPQHA
jgi:hypothetical protein